jgi:hypothetical protein
MREIGARHIHTRPYTPRTNGKAERFIQTCLREWAYAQPYTQSRHRTAALAPWREERLCQRQLVNSVTGSTIRGQQMPPTHRAPRCSGLGPGRRGPVRCPPSVGPSPAKHQGRPSGPTSAPPQQRGRVLSGRMGTMLTDSRRAIENRSRPPTRTPSSNLHRPNYRRRASHRTRERCPTIVAFGRTLWNSIVPAPGPAHL